MPLDRARALMEREGLDGLVVVSSHHVYHASNFWPLMDKMGRPPSCAVLISRRPSIPPVLVMPQFTFYYVYCDGGPRPFLEHVLYTAPDPAAEGGARAPRVYPQADPGHVSALERRRLADLAPYRGRYVSDFVAAVGQAARDTGLVRGRVGVDDPFAGQLLEAAGSKAAAVDACDLLARIRLVKSPLEIDIMRHAATRNAEASLAAVRQARAGMPLPELRKAYATEAAARGLTPVFMLADRVSDELFDAPLTEGSGFLVDCVSHFLHYHGDYGRTVFVGEPPAPMLRATGAMAAAWDAIRERLRPGVRFSEIRAIGAEAVERSGTGVAVGFNPHSVGLFHTDEPYDRSRPLPARQDLVLEPGMILSVDCPLVEEGYGGSAHLEDLTLITADGGEPLHPDGDRVIVV